MDIVSVAASIANRIGILGMYAYFRRQLTKSQVAILMYHRVSPKHDGWFLKQLSPRTFERQMKYFSRHYELISLDKLAQYLHQMRPLPKKAAVITLDDGNRDNYLFAYPILKKYHIPATIFLTTGHISSDKLFWWDKVGYIIQHTSTSQLSLEELGDYPMQSAKDKYRAQSRITEGLKKITEDRKNLLIEKLAVIAGVDIPSGLAKEFILSWDEIKEMSSNGINFGAHTVNHPNLTNMPLEQAEWEIIQSKKDIEQELGKEVNTFSYPYGDFNSDLMKLVKESGFTSAVSVLPQKLIRTNDNIYALSRISEMDDLNKLKAKICGLWEDLSRALRRRD